MKTLVHAIITLVFATCLTGCGISMERVPTALEIRANDTLSKFLIEPRKVYGHYQNLDVDCVVFSYLHNASSESEFWDKLDTALKGTDWKPVDTTGSIRRFERLFPKGKTTKDRPDMAMFSSAEQVRVGYKHSKAVVSYVQADSSETHTTFAEADEAKWAEKIIRPKFEALLK
jgi:hypothetical protein